MTDPDRLRRRAAILLWVAVLAALAGVLRWYEVW